MLTDFRNARVTVMGLGHFGGGVGVTRWLADQGAKVLVTDSAPADKLQDALHQIKDLTLEFRLGQHVHADFTQCDLVVTSPAVKPDNPFLQAALAAGKPVTTEIALFARRCPARVLGVTGTKGKSTTSSLLHHILKTQHPRALLGGNIGGSLLSQLSSLRTDDLVVLELSSFMLHWLGQEKWAPHVGVLTMLGVDHLDWHVTPDAYHTAKGQLFRHQSPQNVAVVDRSDPACDRLARSGQARVVDFAPDGPDLALGLFGDHNRTNARAAIAAAGQVGVDRQLACNAIAHFRGLPHRLELVGTYNGVLFINDSIATNPNAVTVALDAFKHHRVIAIVGGRTKGLDDFAMLQSVASKTAHTLCIGEVGPRITRTINQLGGCAQDCSTLLNAINIARTIARAGDVVLFSPGYTSYDQFANFQERGLTFARLASSS